MKKFLWFFLLCGVFMGQDVYSINISSFSPLIYRVQEDTFVLNIADRQYIMSHFGEFQLWDLRWYKPTGQLYIFYQFVPHSSARITVDEYQVDFPKTAPSENSTLASQKASKKKTFLIEPPSAYTVKQIVENPNYPVLGSVDTGKVVFAPFIPLLEDMLSSGDWEDAYSTMDYDVSKTNVSPPVKVPEEEKTSTPNTPKTKSYYQYQGYSLPPKKQENQPKQKPASRPLKVPVVPYPEDANDNPYPKRQQEKLDAPEPKRFQYQPEGSLEPSEEESQPGKLKARYIFE